MCNSISVTILCCLKLLKRYGAINFLGGAPFFFRGAPGGGGGKPQLLSGLFMVRAAVVVGRGAPVAVNATIVRNRHNLLGPALPPRTGLLRTCSGSQPVPQQLCRRICCRLPRRSWDSHFLNRPGADLRRRCSEHARLSAVTV